LLLSEALMAVGPEELLRAIVAGEETRFGTDLSALAEETSEVRAALAFESSGRRLLALGVEPKELAAAVDRVGRGEAVSAEDVENEAVRVAFERLLLALGLRKENRTSLDGDLGFQGDDCRHAAAALRRRITPPIAPPPAKSSKGVCVDEIELESSDDDDDDDSYVGPSADAAVEREKRKRGKAPLVKAATSNPWTDTPGGGGTSDGARESWMMTPPSELDFRAKAVKSLVPVAKSRFTGAETTTTSTTKDTAAQRAALDAARAKDRGPSLLELHRRRLREEGHHQDNKTRKTTSNNKKKKRWTREDDLVGPAELDPKAKEELIANASSLNDRFTSSVQTSFT